MTKLYLLCGIPFAGKSTFAKKFSKEKGFSVVDFDEVKFEIFGREIKDEDLIQKDWDKVFQKTFQIIENLLKQGDSVIYDMGNFTKKERQKARDIADKLGIETITIFINTPYKIAKVRFLENKKFPKRFDISEADFESACREMEIPNEDEGQIIILNENQNLENLSGIVSGICRE